MRSSPHLFGKITFAFLPSLIVAGPCDIYAAGGTPCVAAHSPVRALFDNYNGTLYQVKRGSDNHTTEIYPLHPGGIANAATQDSFCMSTTCTVSIIYEQTANGNNLTIAPPGSNGQGMVDLHAELLKLADSLLSQGPSLAATTTPSSQLVLP